ADVFWGIVAEEDGARAVAEKAGADENARIVVDVEGGAADFDADREDALRLAGVEEGTGELEIRKSGPATVTDQIREEGGGAKAEQFTHITGEAGTEVTGTGADDQGVDGV